MARGWITTHDGRTAQSRSGFPVVVEADEHSSLGGLLCMYPRLVRSGIPKVAIPKLQKGVGGHVAESSWEYISAEFAP